MKALRRELHPIDHSLIFFEKERLPMKTDQNSVQKKSLKRERWVQRMGKRISNRLFNFETENLRFSL